MSEHERSRRWDIVNRQAQRMFWSNGGELAARAYEHFATIRDMLWFGFHP